MDEACVQHGSMEMIVATGPSAVTRDVDVNYDVQLEQFGVDTMTLWQPMMVQPYPCMHREFGKGG